MAWVYLFIAGLFEIGWAIGLKYSEGYTKLVPTVLTLAGMGASVYTLSGRGAERAASQALNGGPYGGVDLPAGDPSVRRVLLDLTQRATLNRSSVFAGILLNQVGREAPLLTRSHRDENLAVLLAPDVPAVLLEMGFITNPDDEDFLADSAGRRRLMGAVVSAIDAYFAPDSSSITGAQP